MNLKIQTKTIDTQIWVLAIFTAFLIGISFSSVVFMDIQHIDAMSEIYCEAWDIGDAFVFDECVKTINDREFFEHHIFFLHASPGISDETKDNCKLLELNFDVNLAECYAYVEKYPGSTGSDVIEGLKEINHNRSNYILSKPLD